jgi:3-dehydroquinate synthase
VNKIHLDLGDQSYDIHIGSGLISNSGLLTSHIRSKQVFIVSNEVVAGHYLDQLTAPLSAYQVDVHLMPDGEQFKTLGTLEGIIGTMLDKGHNRSTTIVALGGGVVGDTAGFAAASYQRGVRFIQVPTTLLSQVDSSVGGKTAVNHVLGKNMIGAFYQPKTVLIDTDTLSSLPARELSAGLAEVIKHGVLADAGYFEFVESRMAALRSLDGESLEMAISGSCQIKASVVSADEKEAGQRALLNLGHTFGHAIETHQGYGEWLHGEAVGAGIVMAADLSMRLSRCSADEALRIKHLVAAAGLPVAPPEGMSADDFLALMAKDKKATDSGIRFILLAGGIGATEVVDDVPLSELKETLAAGSSLCE